MEKYLGNIKAITSTKKLYEDPGFSIDEIH